MRHDRISVFPLTSVRRSLTAAVVAVAAQALPALAGGTVAFVAAEADYPALSKLPSAIPDAEIVAAALRESGATVYFAENIDASTLKSLAGEFRAAAESAGRVIVYFSGHGANVGTQSLLLPVDLPSLDERDLSRYGMPLEQLLPVAGSREIVLFLDDCWALQPQRDPASATAWTCIDESPRIGPAATVVSRDVKRQPTLTSRVESSFGIAVAAAIGSPALRDPALLASEARNRYSAATGTSLAVQSTVAGAPSAIVAAAPAASAAPLVLAAAAAPPATAIGALPSPAAIPAVPPPAPTAAAALAAPAPSTAPNVLPAAAAPTAAVEAAPRLYDAGAVAPAGSPRAAAVEAAVSILRKLVQAGLNDYVDIEMLIQGLQAGFDTNILPPRSEADLLLSSKLVPNLVSAGVPASSEMVSDHLVAYSFQLGRQQAHELLESGRYRAMPDLQVFRETLKSPPMDAVASSSSAGIGKSRAAQPIKDVYLARSEAEQFLMTNGQRSDVSSLPSGLQYQSITTGNGRLPLRRNTVRLNLTMSLKSGDVIQDSRRTGAPLETPINSLIKGLQEGLLLMREGGRMRLFVPSRLAYGEAGSGAIGPHEVVICDVELLEVIK